MSILITEIHREFCEFGNREETTSKAGCTEISLRDEHGNKKSQSTLLIELGSLGRLFHDMSGDAFSEINIDGVMATMKVRSREYGEYLGNAFYALTSKGVSATAISDAKNTLDAKAKYDGECAVCAVRAHKSKKIHIDIGCDKRLIIEVSAEGWKVVPKSSVKFVRKRGMTALPMPAKTGDVSLLKKYLNVREGDFSLILGWLLCCLGGVRPFPILIFQGEQGTGKSTNTRVLRDLSDPSSVPLRSPPKDVQNLLVSAGNSHIVAIDNLSGLKNDISDALCRLSTGGGIDVRALYTDDEQHLLDIQKPVIINGIDDIAGRPDLSERSFILNLPVISSTNRRTESEIWSEFEADKPVIFAGLLNGLVSGLKHFDQVTLAEKPRIADAAHWITACEVDLDMSGNFIEAHKINQRKATEDGIEASPVGSAILEFMKDKSSWNGTPTQLYTALSNIANQTLTDTRSWPQSPKGLRNIIKRLMPSFRVVGILITKKDTHTREYTFENHGINTHQVHKAPKYD